MGSKYGDKGPSKSYRLNEEERQLVDNFRERRDKLEEECSEAGIDPNNVKHYWYKSELFSIFAKKDNKTLLDLKEELMEGLANYTPVYPTVSRKVERDPHLLVIDPADIHIGKLASAYETGEDYNTSIAIDRVREGVKGLLKYSGAYGIDKVVLIIGNDILHTDNTRRTTTSGTPQDTDGQWFDNFLLAKELYVDIVETLLQVADVHIMHNPSNHDFMAGWYLAETIRTWFRKSKQISFDTDMKHRKAFMYGKNLIGTTHGDGANNNDLCLLMAQEFKQEWAATEHKYIYTHHVHHKVAKEHIGVTIESSRSASGTDSWHHRQGYQHAAKAIEAYLHHPEYGQVARFTHKFE